jgi:hypothetical protein
VLVIALVVLWPGGYFFETAYSFMHKPMHALRESGHNFTGFNDLCQPAEAWQFHIQLKKPFLYEATNCSTCSYAVFAICSA